VVSLENTLVDWLDLLVLRGEPGGGSEATELIVLNKTCESKEKHEETSRASIHVTNDATTKRNIRQWVTRGKLHRMVASTIRAI